jgi:hypothetical protein
MLHDRLGSAHAHRSEGRPRGTADVRRQDGVGRGQTRRVGTQRLVRETIETRVLTAGAQFALQGFLIEEASTRGIRDYGPSLIVARR